jgi:chromosome segregation ATPase
VPGFFTVLLAMLSASPAFAQSLEDRLRDQLRSTLNELHDAQDQQAALQAEKAAAEKERDDLKAQLAATRAQASRSPQNTAQTEALEAEVAKYKDASAQAAAGAQQASGERDQLKAGLADAQKLVGRCEDQNTALLKVGREILDAYEKFDMGDAIGANEPFIAIKRVELENMAQDFDDELHAGRFDPHAKALPASAGSAH